MNEQGKEVKPGKTKDVYNADRVIMRVIVGMFIVSTVFLALSYFVFKSPAYTIEFNRLYQATGKMGPPVGWLIHFGRSFIIALMAVYLLGGVFKDELIGFIKLYGKGGIAIPWLRFVLWFVSIGILIALVVILVIYHWDIGPAKFYVEWIKHAAELGLKAPRHTDPAMYLEYYIRPYAWYFPYSLVVSLLVAPLIIVTACAAIKDGLNLRKWRREITNMISSHSCYEGRILKDFATFNHRFITTVGRYSWLLFGLSVIACYEYWIGQLVLTEIGVWFAIFGYLPLALAVITIFITFSYYESAFRDVAQKLIELDCEIDQFEERYCVLHVTRRIMRWYLVVSLALILVSIATPLANFVTALIL